MLFLDCARISLHSLTDERRTRIRETPQISTSFRICNPKTASSGPWIGLGFVPTNWLCRAPLKSDDGLSIEVPSRIYRNYHQMVSPDSNPSLKIGAWTSF